jgi:hypothetical protein
MIYSTDPIRIDNNQRVEMAYRARETLRIRRKDRGNEQKMNLLIKRIITMQVLDFVPTCIVVGYDSDV